MFTHAAIPRTHSALLRMLGLLFAALLVSTGLGPATATAATPTARSWTVQVGQESHNMGIQGMAFGPKEIWINTGDTVHWNANAAEIHTVSFFNAQTPIVPFNPGDPSLAYMVTPTPDATISAPGQFRNSGIMSTDPGEVMKYSLTFTGPGDYQYVCYVHGQMMMGTVHVRAAGTAYPFSQQQYNAQANKEKAIALAAGHQAKAHAQSMATKHHVFVGAANEKALVMRFIRPTVRIHKGEKVTFDMAMNHADIPHTVTFGQEPANPFQRVGNPANFTGGDLSSGILLPPGSGPVPSTFTVTFNKKGTFHYICALHDGMGMVGKVIVR